jgi:hypothetical protein
MVQQLQHRVTELEAEVLRVKAQQDNYQYLKEETQQYRTFIERERDQSRQFLEDMMKYGALAIALVGGVATFFGWKTMQDVRKHIQESSEKKLSEIRDQAIANVAAAVENRVSGVRDELVVTLTDLNRREQWYKRARVLAVGQGEDLDTLIQPAFSVLEQKGLRVELATHPVAGLAEHIRQGDVNILILRYAPGADKRDPYLSVVIETLREIGKPVPLLVYAEGQVAGDDHALIRGYTWGTYANTYLTLVTNLYQLAHVFA